MLSDIIAWIAALFFLFMSMGTVFTVFTTLDKEGGWYVTGILLVILFLLFSYVAAALGGV